MRTNDPKRVLLISSNSSGRGGGERYLVFLSRGLRELGCEVHALLSDIPYMDAWAESIAVEGVVVHRQRLKGLSQRPLRFIQAFSDKVQIETISKCCRSVEPSAILVNQQYDEDGLDYLMGALKSGIAPVAGVMHMPMTLGKNKRKLGWLRGRILKEWYRKYSYRLILVSDGAQKEFESYYDSPRPTAVVNSSIPLNPETLEKYPRHVFPDGVPVVGFVGQFVFQKNLPCIVQSWLSARNAGFDCRLLLIGDGPERSAVERTLYESAPSGTWHITGWTDSPERLLSEVDLFVLASHFEGLPLSLVEAAARGIPSIVAPFNGAIDVARHAPWVRIAKNNSVKEMSALMTETLAELRELKQPGSAELENFRRFFSLNRMAADVLAVLGLETHACM